MPAKSFRFDVPVAVIGDIHGQDQMLQKLLKHLGDRQVIVTGDVGDRGPGTRQVLDLLVARGALGVQGNHDEWLRLLACGGQFDTWALNEFIGGAPTLESYGIVGRSPREVESQAWKIPKEHRDWLAACPTVLDLDVQGDKYWVTHVGVPAGIPSDVPLDQVVPATTPRMLWECLSPRHMRAVDRPVIMGHMVQLTGPLDLGHVIAIDTGAGFPGGALTAMLLPERTFVQVW